MDPHLKGKDTPTWLDLNIRTWGKRNVCAPPLSLSSIYPEKQLSLVVRDKGSRATLLGSAAHLSAASGMFYDPGQVI